MILRRLRVALAPTSTCSRLAFVSGSLRFASTTSATGPNGEKRLTLGIRREDPGRVWERRCPLIPDAVASLIAEEGIDVVVQSCERRVFSNELFERVSVLHQLKLKFPTGVDPDKLTHAFPFRHLAHDCLKAGAKVQKDLPAQDIVIGIKEVPLNELDTTPVNGGASTHIMFSHTAKGAHIHLFLTR